MEDYILTWGQWFFSVILIIGVYLILRVLYSLAKRVKNTGTFSQKLKHYLNIILQLYEPLGLLLIVVLFVFINPLVHGVLVTFLAIIAYLPIRNYINGRVFLLNNEIRKGQRIKIKKTTGVIQDTSWLGLSLQTEKGVRFFNYTTLLAAGYTQLKGDKVGQLHKLQLKPSEEKDYNHQSIKHKLHLCPYIDWNIQPKIAVDESKNKIYISQLLIREDQHLQDLMELIKEWGYDCSLTK